VSFLPALRSQSPTLALADQLSLELGKRPMTFSNRFDMGRILADEGQVYIQGEGRNQANLFPVVLDDFVPADHVCRVIDAFVEMLVMSGTCAI